MGHDVLGALKGMTDASRGLAALGMSFVVGMAFAAYIMGVLEQPNQNSSDIAALARQVAVSDSVGRVERDTLQRQITAIVDFVRAQTIVTCVLAARIDGGDIQACQTPPPITRGNQ